MEREISTISDFFMAYSWTFIPLFLFLAIIASALLGCFLESLDKDKRNRQNLTKQKSQQSHGHTSPYISDDIYLASVKIVNGTPTNNEPMDWEALEHLQDRMRELGLELNCDMNGYMK